jgi:UDP-3-O-[3-hydroxymyristoyl] glucosamine N-acyltransferase
MADPRFYDNRGPFTLAEICASAAVELPAAADGECIVEDVAGLDSAGPRHLTFWGGGSRTKALAQSGGGFCFVPREIDVTSVPRTMLAIGCDNVQHAYAAVAALFYPDHVHAAWDQETSVHHTARLDVGVTLGPGAVIGPHVEIGRGSRIGPNTIIARGVALGRYCEIGSNVSIAFSYIGDEGVILAGAQIGEPGFGFASDAGGHVKIPQLGRVIVQDRVEMGAATTVDRGALGDTVIGEGTKIDNLVQIGHNTRIGRHCIIVAQAGISGSSELGDFVVLGGQAGVADHARIGSGARLAARCAATPGDLPGGRDYGGVPARPMKQWARELAAVALLAKRRRQERDG